MPRFAAVVMLMALVIGGPSAVHAGGGIPACCICFNCASGPDCQVDPPITCDVVCQQVGCADGATGDLNQCTFFAECAAGPAVAPAPAAGTTALVAMLAALAVVGGHRIRRGAR